MASTLTPNDMSKTKSLLEQYSKDVMEAHDLPPQDAHAILSKHCTADLTMDHASIHECVIPAAANLNEHLRNINALKKSNPDWRILASNFSAVLDGATGEVNVWYTSGASGGTETSWSTNRESVGILHWRRKPGRKTCDREVGDWECYKHSCIRGTANMDSMT